ncbi:MAG: hypothetical protein QW179_02615 [Candidatus Hadarchaeales archaeon]
MVAVAVAIVRQWSITTTENAQYRPLQNWKQFRSTMYACLEETEDNQPIENVVIAGPFPSIYENLELRLLSYNPSWPSENGYFYAEGRVLENSLPPPEHWVRSTKYGIRNVVKVDRLYPSGLIEIHWVYYAPENIFENGAGIYDDIENRRVLFLFNFNEKKMFKAVVHFELLYEDNYRNGTARTTPTRHITWWEWQVNNWFRGPGWYFENSIWAWI